MARRPPPQSVEFGEWLLNVHDVFLNAQLMRTLMEEQPVEQDAHEFLTSPRGRLERAAMRDLYVLIEAFRASPGQHLARLAEVVPDYSRALEQLLDDAERLAALREVRDYMSHRDVRRYYDVGRLSVTRVGIDWYLAVEGTFGTLLLEALRRTLKPQVGQ